MEWTNEKNVRSHSLKLSFDSETPGMIPSLCNVIASGFSASNELSRIIHWTMVLIDMHSHLDHLKQPALGSDLIYVEVETC